MKTIFLSLSILFSSQLMGQCHDTILVLNAQQAFDQLARGLKVNSFISPITGKQVYTQQTLWCQVVSTFTETEYGKSLHKKQDTVKPTTLYGIAGIKQTVPKDSLKKTYYHKYIYYIEKMNGSVGKKSAQFEDSSVKYFKLLNNYKK